MIRATFASGALVASLFLFSCSGSEDRPGLPGNQLPGAGGSPSSGGQGQGGDASGPTLDGSVPGDGGSESEDGGSSGGAPAADGAPPFDGGPADGGPDAEELPPPMPEDCMNGADDDQDGRSDCVDDECAEACSDPCGSAPLLGDPAFVSGSTQNRSSETQSGCTPNGSASGPDAIYRFTAEQNGMLDVTLNTARLLNVSVRTTCTDSASELACGRPRLSIPVVANQTVYVVIDGYQPDDDGRYDLRIASRPIACGDGHRDEGEQCDDDNYFSEDGCDIACNLEPTEIEPNGDASSASTYADPYFAEIAPAGDVDYVELTTSAAASSVTVEIRDLGDDACPFELMDTLIEWLDTDGTTVIASDDDSGPGLCSKITRLGVPPGTHVLRVSAVDGSGQSTFPYRLVITTDP